MPRPRSIHLSIPEPCAQSWAGMQTADGGRFCAHCQKTVVDYSAMSDAAVVRHVAEYGLGCGRFRQEQLEREIVGAQPAKQAWQQWLAAGLSVMFSFGVKEANGAYYQPVQTTVTEQSRDTVRNNKAIVGYARISGRVVDEKQEGLISALVVVTGTPAYTATDYEGNYEVLVPMSDTSEQRVEVEFNYQGKTVRYTDVLISITLPNVLNATLQTPTSVAMVGGIRSYSSHRKKTFWQKLQFWKHH